MRYYKEMNAFHGDDNAKRDYYINVVDDDDYIVKWWWSDDCSWHTNVCPKGIDPPARIEDWEEISEEDMFLFFM